MLVAPLLGLRAATGGNLEVANRTEVPRGYAYEHGLIDNPQVEHHPRALFGRSLLLA